MKTSFRVLIPLVLGVILGLGIVGCDPGEDGQRSTMPPGQERGMPPGGPPGYQQQGQPGGTGSQPQISDADLEKAAAAKAAIADINRQLQQSVRETQDPSERQQLQVKANQRMVQAVEGAGLDFERYNTIMSQVRSDNELGEKFQKKVQSVQ